MNKKNNTKINFNELNLYKVDDGDDFFNFNFLMFYFYFFKPITYNLVKFNFKLNKLNNFFHYTINSFPPLYINKLKYSKPILKNIFKLKINWLLLFLLNIQIVYLNVKNYHKYITDFKTTDTSINNNIFIESFINNLNEDEFSQNITWKWSYKKPKTFKMVKFFNDPEDMAKWIRYNTYRVRKQKISKFSLIKLKSSFGSIINLFKINKTFNSTTTLNALIFEYFLTYSLNTNLFILNFWKKLKRFYNVKKSMIFGFKYFFSKNNKIKHHPLKRTSLNYSNSVWIKKIPLELKNHIIYRWKIKKQFNYLKYFSIFWLGFFENFSNLKTLVHIYKNTEFNTQLKSCIKYFYKKYFTLQIYIGKGFFLSEMLYIFLLTFTNKDIILLKNWVKINFERMDFMKHRKFLYFIKLIIKEMWIYLSSTLKLKGFYFDVRGKLSVSGNAKKRHYLIKLGKYSLSTKNHKIEYTKHLIRTKTGVLGVTFLLIH